jgi:hypothetical protein
MRASEVHKARLTAQGLSTRPGRTPEDVAERLLAIQGQDPRGARLAVRARSEGVVASDVDRALDERRLIVTWVNRGTLHLIRAEDYPVLHAVTTPQLWTSCRTRLRQTGVAEKAERGVEVIAKALADGPRTRAELRDALDSAGVPTAGQALVHTLFFATLHGVCVRGPMAPGGKEQAFVSVRDWLGPQPEVDREAALAEVARRYLVGHGPATEADLARWAQLSLGDVRLGFKAIAGEVEDLGDGLVDLRNREDLAPLPPPRLLGAFDPLLLGWTSRAEVIGDHKGLVTMNGVFKPFALVKGRAVSTWRMAKGEVEIEHLEEVSKTAARALETDARAVEAYFAG